MIIQAEKLNFSYTKNGRQILKDVSLTLKEGEIMSILGPNGAGKSTLLNLLAVLNQPDSGTIKLCGKDTKKMKPREVASIISYVPQNHTPAFSYTVFDFVLMGRAPKVGMFEKPSNADFEIVSQVLEDIGIADLANKAYTEISGGERQQATIARALAQEPKAILFDEPTAHLDYGNQLKTLRVIRSLSEKGYAVIITTHNPDHAIMLGGTTGILDRNGHFETGLSSEIITEEMLNNVYGRTNLKLTYMEEVDRYICVPPNL